MAGITAWDEACDGRYNDAKAKARLSRSTSTDAVAGRAERWPEPGDRMRFIGKNGYPFELEAAMKVMQPGDTFTVQQLHSI